MEAAARIQYSLSFFARTGRGRLEGGWREAGGRLEGGWREAGGRLEGGWREGIKI
jgi:hypothetical protein